MPSAPMSRFPVARPVAEDGGDRAVLADGGGDALAVMDGDAVVACFGARRPGQRGTGDAAGQGWS